MANIQQNEFERCTQKKRNLRPFHIECGITKKRLCYCPNSGAVSVSNKVQMQMQQLVAGNLQEYYDGYQPDFESKMIQKLRLEKERLMNVQKGDFADTFEKFLDYLDEEDMKDFDSHMKNPGSENKKVARYIATSMNQTSRPKTQVQTKTSSKQAATQAVQSNGANKSKDASKKQSISKSGKDQDGQRAGGDDVKYSEACSVCEKKVIPSEEAKSLKCFRCFKIYHSACHQPPLNTDLVKRFQWECSDCKTCKNCNQNNDEDKIIICDMCDKAVHIHCLNPPLSQIPSQNWFCKDCINCVSCDKDLGNIAQKNQGLWYNSIFRICKDCNYQLQQGNFCKICQKAYSQDSNEDFIQCDECQDWIHAACDGFDSDKLAKMNEDEKYVCPICKKKKEARLHHANQGQTRKK
ncbi:histone-lysine n-methyltransferase mll3 [Stylonychia lemnae]|uniref:Histone-lysine n-methyltransferase mll3 n=1 Tax=Stylonychia lemnae TaxID=5949 RepID=A0A078ALF1_STYLE|nr:histone-lysine n-methyltransferase mll3 [Stylonychia lemnae]|eukprot:CDW83044.1 histone-lysine n-methyltransferase mll3 [Stylonychia lemnae]